MKLFERKTDDTRETLALGVGAGVAVAAAVLVWQWRRRGGRGRDRRLEGLLVRLEEDVVERLRGDDRVSGQPIEVAALAQGIVELSGTVEMESDAERAVALAQRSPGVRTVLNRLDVLGEEARAEHARRQPSGPGTARADTRWLGIGVGMGRRRQSRATDPERRDDRQSIVTKELGVNRMVEQTSEILDKIPNAVEGQASASHSGPDDRGTIGETSHRGTGNANPFPQQLDTATPAHENVPPGTELDLEKAGLEGELNEKRLTDHS